MPYRSQKQRRFMHARHPEIAARWDAKYGGKIVPSGTRESAAAASSAIRRQMKRRGRA